MRRVLGDMLTLIAVYLCQYAVTVALIAAMVVMKPAVRVMTRQCFDALMDNVVCRLIVVTGTTIVETTVMNSAVRLVQELLINVEMVLAFIMLVVATESTTVETTATSAIVHHSVHLRSSNALQLVAASR